LVAADTIVICAGQDSERSLADDLIKKGKKVHIIGGADVASELDAKRAIDQGVRLAISL
jgi:2,4-dienoyl-CoA reductase (NADPH2)